MKSKNYLLAFLMSIGLAISPNLSPTNNSQINFREGDSYLVKNNKPDKHALLISGNSDFRHKQNLSLAHKTLLENGFSRENIYILDSGGRYSDKYPINGACTKTNIAKVFNQLEKKVDSTDFFFLYVTGHGYADIVSVEKNNKIEKEKEYFLSLVFGSLSEKKLKVYIKQINPAQGILFFDQCNGGGFANKMCNEKYITLSASDMNEASRSNTFSQIFFKTWNSNYCDKNEDGKISVKEAFDFSTKHDVLTLIKFQTPQLFYKTNPEEIFLGTVQNQ